LTGAVKSLYYPRMDFGTLLRNRRMEAHLSQRALATRINMEEAYLSRIENNKHPSLPTVETIQKFIDALDLPQHKADEMFVTAGRIPPDVEESLLSAPDLLSKVRRMAQRRAA
jgi:transcriptional regulator with XRE-family HTH domain